MNQYVKAPAATTIIFDQSVKITTPRDRTMSMIREIAAKFELTPGDLIRHSKSAAAVEARREVFTILSAKGWTANQIGTLFRRDVSTVQHSLDRARARRATGSANLTAASDS